MKHAKQIKREPKRRLTPEQIAQKKKVKRRFFTILGILGVLIIAYIANDFIIFDKNEKINLVINNNNITANLKKDIIIENMEDLDDIMEMIKEN